MKRHRMYKSTTEGVECSNCEEIVPEGDDCVYMQPAVAEKRNTHVQAKATAKTTHGVLCMDCYDEL